MDETPEELEQIRREAEQIDVYRYKKRFRALAAVGLGSLAAGVVWVALIMFDSRKNPCEKVRNYFCHKDPSSMQCKTYDGILDESLHDDNARMRANIKAQCQSKIDRVKEDEGITIK